jgi:hypothetical protein
MALRHLASAERPFLIFIHIQKTGGITFQRILRRNFGPSMPRRVIQLLKHDNKSYGSLLEAMQAKSGRDSYFAGHICYGAHRHLPQPYTYLCFLREPLQRLISLYNFSRFNRSAYYHEQAAKMSPDEFFRHSGLMELDNGQVRFIAGSEDDLFINRTPFGDCGPALLARAYQNIERDFAFVGITEQFDASLLLMRARIRLRKLMYLRRNTLGPRQAIMPSDACISYLSELNRFDTELYQKMRERLDVLMAGSQNFSRQLENFKLLNSIFQAAALPAYNQYDRLKALLRGQRDRPI